MSDARQQPSLILSLVPVGALIGSLAFGLIVLEISPHVPLIAGCAVAAGIGFRLNYSWSELEDSIVKGVGIAMPAILILIAVGILIGAWVASGVVPLLVFYGLKLLSPNSFLFAACSISAIVAFSSGSSWSTAGTIGVALVGVGQGLGLPLPMVAGAIVSGAYFGDKLSPLSDTTNLAAAVANVPLFEHIRHMLWTTLPSLAIALIIYAILGARTAREAHTESIDALLATLSTQFNLTPWLLLAPGVVLVLIARRDPPLPAILAGAAAGLVLGLLTQKTTLPILLGAMQEGYVSTSGYPQIDELLSRGGLESMFWTIGLIICAMAFGGLMERTRMLATLAHAILSFATTSGKLIASTLATCIGMNIVAPDQYLSIVIPGRMYKEAYQQSGLAAKNLSRCLEDAGTLSSPLVPWNSCGAFMMGALGVSSLAYAPFAFFNLLCPLVSLLYGFTGWTIAKRSISQNVE